MAFFKLKITHGLSHYPDIITTTRDPQRALQFLKHDVSPYSRGFTKIVIVDNKQYVKNLANNAIAEFQSDYIHDGECSVFIQLSSKILFARWNRE
ncbi:MULTISPECIES: hypothetical protein [unclassified Photobacterium]|uniref:hypothetical protein n=1 Tax=unclassified Photobacterium TaxID=2628852 RepID=UPI001EDC9DD3|nr:MULTISPECIES: hypothetical protein [unclassified Photobacterium]MCG3864818.1 hypothetical protein [Photobacterium sp. Ph6]MCG3876186.1 hypothetical protein [Photobacterium sp. Ph5]